MSLFLTDGPSSDDDKLYEDKANCPECGNALDLHQPDPFQPERMLGICADCQIWVLIDVGVGGQLYYSRLTQRPRFPIRRVVPSLGEAHHDGEVGLAEARHHPTISMWLAA